MDQIIRFAVQDLNKCQCRIKVWSFVQKSFGDGACWRCSVKPQASLLNLRHPPSPSRVLSCLSCSAVFFWSSCFQCLRSEICLHDCINTLFKTYSVGYYCDACVFFMCTTCGSRCGVRMNVCACVSWMMGTWCEYHKCLFLVVLVRNILSFVAFISGLLCMWLFVSTNRQDQTLMCDSSVTADLKEGLGAKSSLAI